MNEIQKQGFTASDTMQESYFDGGVLEHFLLGLGCAILIFITVGLATPWAVCILQNWETSRTVINGKRLGFDGTGGALFGKYIVWLLLTIVTLGIYSLWLFVALKKWIVSHTYFIN